MRVLNLNTVCQFKQSPWVASWSNQNAEQRANTKTNFEKQFQKLIKNAFHGRTTQNIRQRTKLGLIFKTIIQKKVDNHKQIFVTKWKNVKTLLFTLSIKKIFLLNLFVWESVC